MMDNQKRQNIWSYGRSQFKEFMKIDFKKWTNFRTLFFGMLITAIIVLPIAMLAMRLWALFQYDISIYYLVISIVFILLMVCNGLSNFYTIRLSKLYNPDMANLKAIDEWSVFFYQTFNPGFAIFILIILFVFRMFTL